MPLWPLTSFKGSRGNGHKKATAAPCAGIAVLVSVFHMTDRRGPLARSRSQFTWHRKASLIVANEPNRVKVRSVPTVWYPRGRGRPTLPRSRLIEVDLPSA